MNLMVLSEPDASDGHLDAAPGGILLVNEQGCVALGEYPLVAPAGSRVAADLSGVEFPGVGLLRFGERIQGSGGYVEAADASSITNLTECSPSVLTGQVAIIHEITTT